MEHADPAQFGRKQPFGAWLVEQQDRGGAIGELAGYVKADPHFPRTGDLKAAWRRIIDVQPEAHLYLAMEEAELDWLAL